MLLSHINCFPLCSIIKLATKILRKVPYMKKCSPKSLERANPINPRQ